MSACWPSRGAGVDFALAAALCQEAGLAAPLALTPLGDGRNNRVARVDLADGGSAVLKCYYYDPRDPRDRLGAEWSFIAYARKRGIEAVPQPLARLVEAHAALYATVAGRKLTAGEVGAPHVAQALDFVRHLNGPPRTSERMAPASEACFSLGDHIATIDRRVARLDAIEAGRALAGPARAFVARRLKPSWQAVRQRLLAAAARHGIDPATRLAPAETCISPSDFGYHNALIDATGRLTFIDFEYAGCDDPAKLVCDFFCQPDIPAPPAQFDSFAAGVIAAVGLSERHGLRIQLLLDAYRLKWICIMLSEFLPIGAARRAYADPRAHETRCREQLAKAEAAFAAVCA